MTLLHPFKAGSETNDRYQRIKTLLGTPKAVPIFVTDMLRELDLPMEIISMYENKDMGIVSVLFDHQFYTDTVAVNYSSNRYSLDALTNPQFRGEWFDATGRSVIDNFFERLSEIVGDALPQSSMMHSDLKFKSFHAHQFPAVETQRNALATVRRLATDFFCKPW